MNKLVEEFDGAKKAYDGFLVEAYSRLDKPTDERARLYAREKMRMAGYRVLDTILWELRIALGGIEHNG